PKNEEYVIAKKDILLQPEKEIKEIKLNSNNGVKEIAAVPRENFVNETVNNEKAVTAAASEKGEGKVSLEADSKSSGNELSNNDNKLNTFTHTEVNKTTVTDKATFASHLNDTVKNIKAAEVVKEITSFIKQGDKTSMTFKLTPEHLGKVKVMIDVTENVVKANIEVESEAVRQVVQNNIDVLKQSLVQSGITVASVNINLAGQEQKSNRTYDQKKKIDTDDSDSKIVKKKGIDKKIRSLGYNTYEFLA
ncbi:MAG: flagellar hook-length control protein FliK, partial [Ignavibacteriaceae bacterium]|nr:flagellar hook-length control protein FliK [Ignavibacteriaceae bacterium]